MRRLVPQSEWYANARPFPHLIVDGAVNSDVLAGASDHWPAHDDPRWETFDGDHERGKRQMAAPQEPEVWRVLDLLRGEQFTRFVTALTGIEGLFPDLLGGGLHESGPGAFLDVHTDFNVHPEGWHRRVNVLLFANFTYEPEWGGALVLGRDRDLTIEPSWNRLVVFGTNARSWHGHPDPWSGPVPRRSFAAYFYTHEPPPDVDAPQGTTWA